MKRIQSKMEKLLDTKAASALLGVSRQFLERDRWLNSHEPEVPYIKIGKRVVRYKLSDIEELIKNGRIGDTSTHHRSNNK